MMLPLAATVAWGAAIYQPGDEGKWLAYARLSTRPNLINYLAKNTHDIGSLYLELMPATLMLPFIPWPWRRQGKPFNGPAIVAPLVLYSGICTAILFCWPGVNTRYAMPIAPSVAVLAGIAWDALEKSWYAAVRRVGGMALCVLIIFQVALVTIVMPLFARHFGETRVAGQAIERAISAAPAPAYCLGLDTNVFFYLHAPPRCLDLEGMAAVTPPAWLLIPYLAVPVFATLRPDVDARIVLDSMTEAQLTATRIDKK
jgi:hypothetical protein